MSELDHLKEQIAYMKLWLGIFIVTNISLIGWLVTHYEKAEVLLVTASIITLFSIFTTVFLLHRKIQGRIDQLKEK